MNTASVSQQEAAAIKKWVDSEAETLKDILPLKCLPVRNSTFFFLLITLNVKLHYSIYSNKIF